MVQNGNDLDIRTVIKDDNFASPRKLLYEFFALRIIFSLDFLVIEELSFVFSRTGIELETSRVEADRAFPATYVLHLHFTRPTRVVPLALTANGVQFNRRLNCSDAVGRRNTVVNGGCYKIGHSCCEVCWKIRRRFDDERGIGWAPVYDGSKRIGKLRAILLYMYCMN